MMKGSLPAQIAESLAMRARAYDFKAYQQLLKQESNTNDNANIAKQVLAEIDRSLERDRNFSSQISKHSFDEVQGTYVYNGPFTSDEIAIDFPSIEQNKYSLNREGFVNTASDMNQPLFMSQLIAFLTNEPDLLVADRITLAISQLSKQDFHPHDYEQILGWWRMHQNEFTNWPNSEFQDGIHWFSMGQYRSATKSFNDVIQVDPTADKSRALAMACDSEIGETNTVETLAKGFKYPDGRWAKWAAAKAALESGDISNATVQLAFITTNFPTMDYLPNRTSDIWKKVDWSLFNKLTKTETH